MEIAPAQTAHPVETHLAACGYRVVDAPLSHPGVGSRPLSEPRGPRPSRAAARDPLRERLLTMILRNEATRKGRQR